MDATLQITRSQTLWARITRFFAFVTRIKISMPRLKLGADDPAALYYAKGKNYGDID